MTRRLRIESGWKLMHILRPTRWFRQFPELDRWLDPNTECVIEAPQILTRNDRFALREFGRHESEDHALVSDSVFNRQEEKEP